MTKYKLDFKAPKKSEFLPNISIAYLKECYKKETTPRVRDRLLSYMQRKQGKTLLEIANNLNRTEATIHNWIKRASIEGIKGRYEREGRGRKDYLEEDKRKELFKDLSSSPEKCGFESSLWDSNLIRLHIKKKFGVEYTKGGAYDLLTRNGFTWKKARPKNPASASKKEQEEFKKNANKIVKEKTKQGYTILAGDASSIQKAQNKPAYGWRKSGKHSTTPSFLSRERKYVFGVLALGMFYFLFYDKVNSDSFIHFLGKVYKKFGKFVLFIDNASYHKSKKVQDFIDSYNGEIILEYLPPYTAELNPIEIQWREMKRLLSAKIFEDLGEMVKSVRKMYRKKELRPVKLFNYLTI